MSRKKIILIWIICLSPFFGFITLMYIVKINTISEVKSEDKNMISWEQLEKPENNLASVVYSSDGVTLGKYFQENRQDVHYRNLAQELIDALISTEDIRFRQHSGIDIRSLFRASYGVLLGKSESGGASTISQQLSKMLFTKEPSSGFDRVKQKLKEWVVAVELEKRYSKNEIIAMYLNRFDWNNQGVGIFSASKTYFNTTPEKLTTNQSAMLVGMLKNPSLYNPRRNPEGTKNRRNVVLSQMMKNDKISKSEFDSLKVLSLGLDFQKTDHNEGPAPYFREMLRKTLKEWCSSNINPATGEHYNLYTDGLKVYTTIDSRIQTHAEQAVKDHMMELQKEFYKAHKRKKYPYIFEKDSEKEIKKLIDAAVKRSERYRKLKNQGKSESEIEDIFDTKVNTSLFSWQGAIDTFISPRDSIIWHKWFLHTGLMSMDPNTGHVKAYVGGINHHYFQYDHVKGTRQVGSTFKPFLYSLAIQEGMNPCDKIFNSPVIFYKDEWNLGEDYEPENSSPQFNELELSLKFGLANSLNIMTASIMKDYGPESVVDMARKMEVEIIKYNGIKLSKIEVNKALEDNNVRNIDELMRLPEYSTNLPKTPSLCLGVSDITVKKLTAAYSVFANQGNYTEPIFITKITDKNDVILEEFTTEKDQVLSQETAAIMVELLKGVVGGVKSEEKYAEGENKGKTIGRRGTGMSLKGSKYRLKSEIGGKTGTTQGYSDGWFVGITPNLVTSVWVGCEDRAAHFKNKKGYGSHTALPIFGKLMRNIYDDKTIKNVTEKDIFEYDVDTRKYVEEKMNCNQNDDIEFLEQPEDF